MSGPGADQDWAAALDAHARSSSWRCLSELVDDPAWRERARAEFPEGADAAPDAVTRRAFLRLLSATVALGAAACTRAPREDILPYAEAPSEVVPGVARRYATSFVRDGYATGVLVESHEGRPTKVEGHPAHPASLGAAGAIEQAQVLGLYDPSRARAIREGREPRARRDVVALLSRSAREGGAGLSVLLEPTSSPTVVALVERVRARLPRARFYFDAPLNRAQAWEGARLALGRALEAQYDFSEADVVLALDADPLAAGPFALRYARQVASRRRGSRMSRVYAVECCPSLTGSLADHRMRARRGEVAEAAAAVLAGVTAGADAGAAQGPLGRWAEVVARDLRAHAGRAVVVVGDGQPAAAHAAAHAINAAVAGPSAAWLTEPAVFEAGAAGQGIGDLARELRAGRVDTLLVLGGNPAYTAPAELDFAAAMRRASTRLRLGLYEDESAAACEWFVPEAHPLESWGDARARDGTASIVQPLIAPLYDGRTVIELLAVLAGAEADGGAMVRARWGARWDAALRSGIVAGTALPRVDARVDHDAVRAALAAARHDAGGVEVGFVADAKVYDGRFANNAWLQELPDPMTRLAWENAALLSPATAARLGLATGDLVEVTLGGRRARGPAFVLPGHADEAVTLPLGYGRRGAEALARGVGFDAYRLRTSDAAAFAAGGAIAKLGPRRALATTQSHWSLEGRQILRAEDATRRALPTLYTQRPVPAAEVQWGMAVDLSACVGCGACVVACQAENNVPVVGREGVLQSREMHWLRVDRYFVGDPRDPRVAFEPMLCQHCEKAPCEYVCPVNATTHSPDGINEQTYNRCVGTRFCSNNCPYKVRRFNWLDYRRDQAEVVSLAMNPEVTVRQRGVMEKCTYCLQRVRRAQRDARVEGRPIRDGDVVTACQQTCPAEAITFGPVSDPDAEVSRLHRDPRAFRVLESLGTEPRTRYLARVTNPNPELEGDVSDDALAPVMVGRPDDAALTRQLLSPTWDPPRGFGPLLAVTGAGTLGLFALLGYTAVTGVGLWGNQIPVAWGFAIINFVWWIGIGHAGTFISAVLLLLGQQWRASINRFAEAMTLCALVQAGIFPLIHLGRPWFAYWLVPYPSTMGVWPQFRSALPWDAAAITTYLSVSIVFWYMGLIPDLAAMRDRAPGLWRRRAYGFFALGWRGGARQWSRYRVVYGLLAGLATPLVVSVHSIVSTDFAESLLPGWHSTIFPVYFVVGAVFSGFAMVLVLLIPARRVYRLHDVITARHLDALAKLLVAGSMFMSYSYVVEAFTAWYGGDPYERYTLLASRPGGSYAWLYWTMIACNCVAPLALWSRRLRASPAALMVVSLLVVVGMWVERFVLIVTSQWRDFLPSSWALYTPTWVDGAILLGTISCFAFLFLLFLRWVPIVPLSELKSLRRELPRERGEVGDAPRAAR